MNCIKPTLALVIFSLLSSLQLFGQHVADNHKKNEVHEEKHFRCSLTMDHTYIGTETARGISYHAVPAVGFDAEYWFTGKWGLGLHNDMELVTYVIHKGEELLHERNTPLLVTMDGLWKPYKHFVFLIGPGVELEEEETLFVVRGGLEYEIELSSHWDIAPTVFYDTRLHAFDTFSIGIGIGKRF
ncbi:hypothetical protein [Botryobacter ruber]|uniref:hypothetical protein n=1 Tax=Botryobacter ruber TaxID=2171629 RepID=UPI000E0C516E|nr:hypothetical protein [Botryobacter ruber]